MRPALYLQATVVRWTPATGAWSALGVAGFSADYIDSPSLALAQDGTPFLAFVDCACVGSRAAGY